MPDLEDRLRTALAALADDMADEVAASEDPRAELDRRLAARRRATRRVPALTAAAAAVVLAAVFVPVVATQDAPPAPGGAAAPPLPSERPSELGTFTRDGGTWRALGYLRGDRYCTVVLPRGVANTARPTCEPVPTWPEGPTRALVLCREVLNGDPADDTGTLSRRLVFLTDPRVVSLAVRRGDGTAVTVSELDRNEYAAAFLADFAGPVQGFGYTARDGGGSVLEEAIT